VDATGLERLTGILAVAPGDFDNDGATDLAIVATDGVTLWRNAGNRKFVRHDAALPAGRFTRALWIDYDHDYDVDLFLFGPTCHLLRNADHGTFTDATAEFPFVAGEPLDAVSFKVAADAIGQDVLVSYSDRVGVMYVDRLAGTYDAIEVPAIPARTRALVVADLNHDGSMDVVVEAPDGVRLLINDSQHLKQIASSTARGPIAVADFEDVGAADVYAGDQLLRLARDGVRSSALMRRPAVARVVADFDGDGAVDVVTVDQTGTVWMAVNTTTAAGRWIRVSLRGVKNLKAAPEAQIEVKAGALYQKAAYRGVPVVFGLGDRAAVDVVRVTWPNGLVQNETRQASRRSLAITEAPRLSGSCPMIFTWDGAAFRFLTDVLGVAPLGASAGDGEYFPVDHDEYVSVPGEALSLRDGGYEVRVTEELREVSYLDRIQLIAVDHPSETAILANDKFRSPPFPEFRLFGVDRPIPPRAAHDDHGHDVLDRVLALDHRYPDDYARDFEGAAAMHALDLDFGDAAPDNRAVLVLSGWVDWADGSTFRGAAQSPGRALVMPYLQVRDAQDAWRTVVEEIGIPAGKPKTIVVDLTGKFLSPARQVRIVTNLCVYWDQIYLSERTGAPDVRLTPLDPTSANLRFRGFSRVTADPQRKQPETFDYGEVSPTSMWNPTSGFYTRYGDVASLLNAVDDRLVVMGSGDEIQLRFDAAPLPRLPAAWRRDFLIMFDGWAKDADANTAFSQTVEPLPFHGMSAYPYRDDERFPRRDEARAYNTRPALRLLRPLAGPSGRH
jgi:hypothetical protein